MTITEMPHDITGHTFQALNPKTNWEVELLKDVPSTPIPLERHSVVRLYSDTDCHAAFDDLPATEDDMFLPAGKVEYFKMPNISGLSFITSKLKGTVYVSLME